MGKLSLKGDEKMKRMKKKRTRIIISGYYGFGSIGDDAVLRSILTGISQKLTGAHVTVLTKNKKSIPNIQGITLSAIKRYDIVSLILCLLRSRLFISGGGSLLQDHTSKRSLAYYTSLIFLAKLCGCKIYIFANGIGPVENTEKCKKALFAADVISLRDPDSYSFAKMLLPEKEEIYLTADPVFLHSNDSPTSHFLSCFYDIGNRPYFAVSVRKCCGEKNIDCEKLISSIKYAKCLGYVPVFVSMQKSFDLELSRCLAQRTGGIVADVRDEKDLCRLLDGASFAIGMRLHFLLFSVMRSVPVIPLSYDQKVESCLRYMGVSCFAHAFDFVPAEINAMIQKALYENNGTEKIKQRISNLAALANNDIHRAFVLTLGNEKQSLKEIKPMEEVSG